MFNIFRKKKQNASLKEEYFYSGRLPKATEDLIISFKNAKATSGSTEDGLSIHNQLIYFRGKAIAFRDKNGKLHINIEKGDEYEHNILVCLARGYQSSDEYTHVRNGEKELYYLVYKEIRGTDDEYIRKPKELILKLPNCNMELEYLDLIKNRKVGEMFSGNAGMIPEEKREKVKQLYVQWLSEGLLYITNDKESAIYSFTKNDLTKTLRENNLPINGNKPDLVDRIVEKLGYEKLSDIGEIKDSVRLSDIGKLKIKEYRTGFKEQYISFRQEIESLFESNHIVDACYNVTRYNESFYFYYDGLGSLYNGRDLYSLCVIIKESDVFEKIRVPKEYHEVMLNTMCMYFSLVDFDYKRKLEEIYNGFEELLMKSDIIIDKDIPYADFINYLNGFKHLKYSKVKLDKK